MLSPALRRSLIVCLISLGGLIPAVGLQAATVALAVSRPPMGEEGALAERLLALVELHAVADKALAVVEHRQINLTLKELILDRSRPGGPQLEVGRLLTADFIALLELVPPDADTHESWGRLLIVDPKTGAIAGVTAARIDETTLEETADQWERFISAVVRAPNAPQVTVAVAPFASQGRFDRLRPLELGIRDLITLRLLALSGDPARPTPVIDLAVQRMRALRAGLPIGPEFNAARKTIPPGQTAPKFQVVQRSNMEQLSRELDLIQSGLADKTRLPDPDKLPPCAATYLVRGEIDERQEGEKYTVIVRGQLVQAGGQKVLHSFEFECPPKDVELRLADEVDKIALRLMKEEKIIPLAHVPAGFEVAALKDECVAELQRFVRLIATTHELRVCRTVAPGWLGNAPRQIDVDSPHGRYMLKKMIDSLESTLFIKPDDAVAAYGLGFCYSIHLEGIYQRKRADELLRKAFLLDSKSQMGAWALQLLADVSYDDRTGVLDPGDEAVTLERINFAFDKTPPEHRDSHWGILLKNAAALLNRPQQSEELARWLAKSAQVVEAMKPEERRRSAGMYWVQQMARQLIRQAGDQTALKNQGVELLSRWTSSPETDLAGVGRQGLAGVAAAQKDYLGAAAQFEAAAAKIVTPSSPLDRRRRDQLLIDAARNYRLAGQPQRALDMLLVFQDRLATEELAAAADQPNQPGTTLLGAHGFEVGDCYKALGKPEKAHEAYLRAAMLCPLIVHYDNHLKDLIDLGGVPLRDDRDVDVRYFSPPWMPTALKSGCLAFDKGMTYKGKIYYGGEQGLYAFDVFNEVWQPTAFAPRAVTCLKAGNGSLWVGTGGEGLWRRDPATDRWVAACDFSLLPDLHVESLALDGSGVYCGVGTKASGGLVHVGDDGKVKVFADPLAPRAAPTHLVVGEKFLLARTEDAIHRLTLANQSWEVLDLRPPAPRLFAGTADTWASGYQFELTRLNATAVDNQRFRPAWYLPANNTGYVLPGVKAGYQVDFIVEHGDEVWFGGDPWTNFISSGLYRFNLKTGTFHKFGPADGFHPITWHRCFDGLWANDMLWLATTDGLCVVTPRKAEGN